MKSTMRLLALLLTGTILFSGCADSDRVDELESTVDELENKLSDIKSEFDDVLEKMRNLESEIDDFSYEDWKLNVPEVVDAFDDLERAVRDVEYEF